MVIINLNSDGLHRIANGEKGSKEELTEGEEVGRVVPEGTLISLTMVMVF